MPELITTYELIKELLPFDQEKVDQLKHRNEDLQQQINRAELEQSSVLRELHELDSQKDIERQLRELENRAATIGDFVVAREMRLPFEDTGPGWYHEHHNRQDQIQLLELAKAKANSYRALDQRLRISTDNLDLPFIRYEGFTQSNKFRGGQFGKVMIGWLRPGVGVSITDKVVEQEDFGIPGLAHQFKERQLITDFTSYAEVVDEERWDDTWNNLLQPVEHTPLSFLTGEPLQSVPDQEPLRYVLPLEPERTAGFVVGRADCQTQIDFLGKWQKGRGMREVLLEFIEKPKSQEQVEEEYSS